MSENNQGGRRRWAKRAAIVAATAAVVAPATVWAANIPDVPDGYTHHDNINWAFDNGVTSGCGGGNYCPEGNVSRGQMASFMRNLAGYVASAGVYVTRDDTDSPVIQRYYNNVNDTAPTISGGGLYTIDMGFDVTDRIIQCTLDTAFVDTRDAVCNVTTPGGNTVRVRILDTDTDALVPGEFFLTVTG